MQTLSQYTFGAEFEVILPPRMSFAIAVTRIAALTGLPVVIGNRTALTRSDCPDWRIVTDGSVHGAGTPGEFVSPILKGQDGIDQVRKFADALVTIGATVNASCGFHVHVGGFRPEIGFFKTLVKLYARYENAIDQIMPASRRANAATYCRSITRATPDAIDRATTIDQIIELKTGLRSSDHSSRYYKLNLQSFRKHRTVEFRQHAGTTDSKKAINWIKTCLRMVLAAQNGKCGTSYAMPTSFEHLPVKARVVAEMVTRPTGATRAEIIVGTDWAALSVNRQARLAGIEIRTVRERGQDRFFAVANETASVPTDLNGLAALIESAPDEIAFLNGRAQVFAA